MGKEFIDKHFDFLDNNLCQIQYDLKFCHRENSLRFGRLNAHILVVFIGDILDEMERLENAFRAQRDRIREQELDYTEKWVDELLSNPEELEILKSLAEK